MEEKERLLQTCCIDLHVHMDGSLSVETVRALAELAGEPLTETDLEIRSKLSVSRGCRDLSEYLDKFVYPLSFLQTAEQLSECAYRVKEELRQKGLLYAELRFAPQSHRQKGLSQEQAVQAVIAGAARSELPTGLILCCMRGQGNEEENRETVRLARKYLGKGVCALDIAGAEGLFPTEEYEDLFACAAELGVPFTIHAGEAAGPESVRAALRFGAKRIGHGVRSAEDPALLRQLADSGALLELCPTSNLHTGLFPDYESVPLRALLDAGVKVSINSDNMAVSHTWVGEELRHMAETFSLTDAELRGLLQNAARGVFADEETKDRLLRQIENV